MVTLHLDISLIFEFFVGFLYKAFFSRNQRYNIKKLSKWKKEKRLVGKKPW